MQSITFRHRLMLLLVVGILWELGFIYWDTLVWMKISWFGYPPDRAGMLVPPLFLWMVYVRLKHHPKTTDGAPYMGFLIMLCCLAAFILARIIDINFIQGVSLVGVMFGMVVFLGGRHLGENFLFPFAFLMLMIPSISYLIESIAGAFLRQAVHHGSYTLLHLTNESWQIHPAGLMSGDLFLQVGFPRGGPSSLLFLLIVHFALTEWFIKSEGQKFFFMVHFPLYFVVAYILYYSIIGWIALLGGLEIDTNFLAMDKWMSTLLFFLFSGTILFLVGRGKAKRDHRLKGGR